MLEPYASINPRGEIALNPPVFDLLEGLNYVSLHYDDETGHIAIARPTFTGQIYNVKSFGRKGRLRVVRARRFLKHFQIEIPQTVTFTEITHHPGPVLILNLRKAIQGRATMKTAQTVIYSMNGRWCGRQLDEA